jgi:outer membrane protein TolC
MSRRKCLAAGFSFVYPLSLGVGQQGAIAPAPAPAPSVIRPYLPTEVPPVRLSNSPRLAEMVRAGTVYLSAEDAVALALESSIDIEIVRYNSPLMEWNLIRAEAGGLLPGVPSNASQAGSVASGQGVAGSQQAAGVIIPGSTSGRTQTTNATISQVGVVTPALDPTVLQSSTFSHTTTAQPNSIQSRTLTLVSATRAYTASIQQGLLMGGTISLNYTEHYLNENATTDLLNPSSAPSLSLSVQQNLLQGFGTAVNGRTITVARMNRDTADLSFETTVAGVIEQVLNAYYSLEASYEDLTAKKIAAETAATFLAVVKEQVRVGVSAPSEIIAAEQQLVNTTQAQADSQTTLAGQELELKNLLSRDGTADPIMRSVRIQPVDSIVVPDPDDLPSLAELVKHALANRTDLAAERESVAAAAINNLGTKSALLPTGVVFASMGQTGLAGTRNRANNIGVPGSPDPSLLGGLGTALGQVFRGDYPLESVGTGFFTPLRNRQAIADYAIDELTLRQMQLSDRRDVNQVQVDINNYVVALRQARAAYETATHKRILQEELYQGERRRFELGASTAYNVTQQQRDLTAAESSEVAARVAYIKSRIGLERTTGDILSTNHVTLAEARQGTVRRKSANSVPEKQK